LLFPLKKRKKGWRQGGYCEGGRQGRTTVFEIKGTMGMPSNANSFGITVALLLGLEKRARQ
jgi:hypothetical protein